MPELMSILGLKIYFWINEGYPLEPIHVHVSKNYHKNATKIWITSKGECLLENNNDKIPLKDLKKVMKTIETYHEDIEKTWETRFGKISYKDNQNCR